MPNTSANDHMFSLLSKDGALGIRFSKERQTEYIKTLTLITLHLIGAVMKAYIFITDDLLKNWTKLKVLLNESNDYAMSLKPK